MRGLVDTHCHLQAPAFSPDRAEVLERSLDTLDWLVVIGDDLDSSVQAVDMTGNNVFAAAGVHPYHADCVNTGTLERLRELAAHPGVVAIGEIGLDYFRYAETTPETQRKALEAQLQLAAELALPVVIHNRDADADMAAILANAGCRAQGIVMHCFGSDAAFAETCLELGCHISFAGNVTFPKAETLREAAAAVPPERLLIETDSPYLAPQPVRGKRCEPGYVRHTAACLAGLKGITIEAFAEQTSGNAAALFGIAAELV